MLMTNKHDLGARQWTLLAMTTLSTLVLTACGGGGSDAPANAEPSNQNPPAPIVEPKAEVIPNQIAAGAGYTVLRSKGGAVQVVGTGMSGALDGLADTIAVGTVQWEAGRHASFAIDATGTARGWGDTADGQLMTKPTKASSLGVVNALRACGAGQQAMVYAVKSSGKVWAAPASSMYAAQAGFEVPGLENVETLSDEGDATCSKMLAIKADGTVWQLLARRHDGAAGVPDEVAVSQVAGLSKIAQASCVADNCLAVERTTGAVYGWGSNDKGQLGTGNKLAQSAPVTVPGVLASKVVLSVDGAAYAVTQSGKVCGWGLLNTNGVTEQVLSPRLVFKVQGQDTSCSNPNTVDGLVLVTDLAVSPQAQGHAVMLRSNGSVLGWGDNSKQQLGSGLEATFITSPTLLKPAVNLN